jgi:O-antigen ligase
LYLLAVLAPFSVEFAIWEGTQLTLPIEICLMVIGGGLVVSMPQYLGRLWPERWLLGSWVVWIGWWWISAFVADQQVVAFKYVAAETLVAVVCLLGAYLQPRKAVRALWYYGVSSLVLQAWIVVRHGWSYGFISDQANLAGIPFYYDHNLYATIAIMAVLVVRGIYGEQKTMSEQTPHSFWGGYLWWLVSLVVALVSTSRGALLSVLVTGGLFYFFAASKRIRWSMVALGVALGLGMWQLREKLQHDVSMRERINRYHCVWEMAQAHPLTGVGPGNFQFSYLAYQRPEYQTRISVKEPLTKRDPSNYGHGGGTHSEYGRWLAEMGWPGWILGCIWNIWIMVMIWQYRSDKFIYWIGAALCTLWVHSWVNDFFHEVRLSLWYWTLLGLILSHSKATSDNFNKKTSNLP